MKMLLISNMYPSVESQTYGIFVQNFFKYFNRIDSDLFIDKIVISGRSKSIYMKLWKYIKFYSEIVIKILMNKYDIIYVHFPTYAAPVLACLPLQKKNVVLNFHGSDIMLHGRKSEILKKITKKVAADALMIVVPSSFLADEVYKQLKVSKEKIFISPSGGINQNIFFPKDKTVAREKISIDKGKFTIGFISRIDTGKGWDIFLHALVKLKSNSNIPFQALIVGDGKEKEQLLLAIQSLKLEDIVFYFGLKSQDELPAYYNSMDIFINSSTLLESLSLVGLEAMSCSIPVIGSNQAGIATYVKNEHNGYLFSVGDVNDLTNTIKKYINISENIKEKMKKNALHTSRKYEYKYINLTLEKNIKKLINYGEDNDS